MLDTPTYVYKITHEPPPTPLPDLYPLSELDAKDGFIHLSTGWQVCLSSSSSSSSSLILSRCLHRNEKVPETAALYFQSFSTIYILKLRLSNFDPASVKWDEGTTRGCPHLYGRFGAKDIESVKEFRLEEGESWRKVLEEERKGWLE
jgi:Protein of unknown function (DUF952).